MLEIQPDEVLDTNDPGDDVTQRYWYQHCYAAINAVRLLDGDVELIVCENHEDFLIKRSDSAFVGVQVKTRASDQPAFKAQDLVILKALGKFCIIDQQYQNSFVTFEFHTNHRLWDEQENQNNLCWLLKKLKERGGASKLKSGHPLRAIVEGVAAACNLPFSSVQSTLLKTVANAHNIQIRTIRSDLVEALGCCPQTKGFPYSFLTDLADDIVAITRSASGNTLKGSVQSLYEAGADIQSAQAKQILSGKKIERSDVEALVEKYASKQRTFENLDIIGAELTEDTPKSQRVMTLKMARGGVEYQRVEIMHDLVHAFEHLYIQWVRKYGAVEAGKRRKDVLSVVAFEGTEATVSSCKKGDAFGSEMYVELFSRLQRRCTSSQQQIHNSTPEHLMGGAGLLTQQCKLWWSKKFQINEESDGT
jgi:Cap4 dsDNA endonuclease